MKFFRSDAYEFLDAKLEEGARQGQAKRGILLTTAGELAIIEAWKESPLQLVLSAELEGDWLVSCYGLPGSSTQLHDCQRAVSTLHSQGIPSEVILGPPRLTLLGRQLNIPVGCSLLRSALQSDSSVVRGSVVDALRLVPGSETESMIAAVALTDPEAFVRRRAFLRAAIPRSVR